jgi:hypothetical protein
VSVGGLGRQRVRTEKDGQEDGEPLGSAGQGAPNAILDLMDDLAPLVGSRTYSASVNRHVYSVEQVTSRMRGCPANWQLYFFQMQSWWGHTYPRVKSIGSN